MNEEELKVSVEFMIEYGRLMSAYACLWRTAHRYHVPIGTSSTFYRWRGSERR